MKFGFWELVLLACISLILFGPTVIPRVQHWLRRADQTKRQVQRQRAAVRRQMVAEGNAILHRFQVVTAVLLLGGAVGYTGYLVLHTPALAPLRYTPTTAAMPLTTAGSAQTRVLDLAPYEDPLAVAAQDGWLYAAVAGNKIIRVREDGTGLAEVFSTEGPVTAMTFAPDGSLYLAGGAGLYRASFDGWAVDVKPLLTQLDGAPLTAPTALAAAPDGMLYFTQYADVPAMAEDPRQGFFTELLAHSGTGAVYGLDPATGEVVQVTGGLSGAGGLAVSADGETLYLSETNARRVWQCPVSARGEDITQQGSLVLEGLDGYAAGLHRAPDGNVWVAVCGTPVDWVDKMAPHPLVRKMALNLPRLTQRWLLTPAADTGWAICFAPDGTLVRAAAVPTPKHGGRITGVWETEETIWLANADGRQLYGVMK